MSDRDESKVSDRYIGIMNHRPNAESGEDLRCRSPPISFDPPTIRVGTAPAFEVRGFHYFRERPSIAGGAIPKSRHGGKGFLFAVDVPVQDAAEILQTRIRFFDKLFVLGEEAECVFVVARLVGSQTRVILRFVITESILIADESRQIVVNARSLDAVHHPKCHRISDLSALGISTMVTLSSVM